jgi:cobalamin biosynthesis Mg chelatase CobN
MTVRTPLFRLLILGFCFSVAFVAAPSATMAASAVLDDWREDGTIDGNYTVAQLQAARGSVSPEELEYSDFDLALRAAISRAARRNTSSGSSGTGGSASGGAGGTSASSGDSDDSSTTKAKAKAKKSKKKADASSEGDLDDKKLSASAAQSGSAGNADDSGSGLIWFTLAGITLLLVAAGIIQLRRMKRPKD